MEQAELPSLAFAAYGPDPAPHLFVALAPHAPVGCLPTLRDDIGRWLLGKAPLPGWARDALPVALNAAADDLRRRLDRLEDFAAGLPGPVA